MFLRIETSFKLKIMNILVAGDYCDNGRVSKLLKQGHYEGLFADLKEVMSDYDCCVVNFEFPIVINIGRPIKKCGPALKGQPDAIEALKYAGFNVCTLANNHVLDQGTQCLLDTKSRLEDASIKTVGAGANNKEASKVLIFENKGETAAIINCCEHEFSIASESSAGANPLNIVAQYRSIKKAKVQCDYVIVIVHGGIEHFPYPTKRMKETYHFFVDAGADAVINHHQHCYCGYEIYKGKPIYYGLGNFLFDWEGKRNSIWNRGCMVGLSLTKGANPSYTLYPYTQCDDQPGVFLMKENEREQFLSESEHINAVIQNDELLEDEFNKHVASKMKEYSLLVEPYDSRLTRGLYNRGLMPSAISMSKLTKLYNFILCESHYEVMLAVLKGLMKRMK